MSDTPAITDTTHTPPPAALMDETTSRPGAAHTSTRTYLVVFAWLAVMTAIEVAITAAGLPENIRIIILVVLAIIKAALVVLFYMHLMHDSKWYWVILIAPIAFVVMLTQFLIAR
jgi:cytochrome c oxidase subunit 4